MTSSVTSWDRIVAEFTSDYSVSAVDLRGHGLSSKPKEGYRWADDYAADVVAFINEVFQEPVILVGHSLGAMIAPAVAVNAPDKVRAIVMEDPPAFRPSEDHQATRSRFVPVLEMKRMPYAQRLEIMMKEQGMGHDAAVVRADNLELLSESVLLELLQGVTAYKPADYFPRVSCPSMVILGNPELGAVVDVEDRPRLRSLLPQARVIEWDDVGHGIHAEQPERFVSEVKGFLSEL